MTCNSFFLAAKTYPWIKVNDKYIAIVSLIKQFISNDEFIHLIIIYSDINLSTKCMLYKCFYKFWQSWNSC